MSTIYSFTYQSPTGNYYAGYVASESGTAYNYTAGQTYQSPYGGTYTIGQPVYSNSQVSPGSVYCTYYHDASNNQNYQSYHYDPGTGQYYDVYSISPSQYLPTGSYNGVSLAAGTEGLGSEYDYVQSSTGYHVYGEGGYASAQITPSTTYTPENYAYKFTYTNGNYYTGTVYDDGTYGYSVGYTKSTPYGEYSITGTAAPSANEMAGYVYANNFNYNGQSYYVGDSIQTSPYYNKPIGYGGLGTETDYVKYTTGYYKYGAGGQYAPGSGESAVATIPHQS